MKKALIDGDVLVYQASFVGQMEMETGGTYVFPFSKVQDYLDTTIENILKSAECDSEPMVFLTYDEGLLDRYNKETRHEKEFSPSVYDASRKISEALAWSVFEIPYFVPNFRYGIAKTQGYKSTRGNKPYHYLNTRAYLLAKYDCLVFPGIEADDAMSLIQASSPEGTTVICSRDKDLKMNPGYFYGWSAGLQEEQPLHYIEPLGKLSPPDKNGIKGEGMLFFFAQMIMGDRIDTIPGLPKKGPSFAYKILSPCTSIEEAERAVTDAYKDALGPSWNQYYREQAALLWMVREVDSEGYLLGHDGWRYGMKLERPITFWRNNG